MKFFTVGKLGPKRHVTPEGYLVCEEAVLARTGPQMYRRQDIYPPPDDTADSISVERNADEVFADDAIASANGKSVTDDHPPGGEFVTPDTYSELSKGHILHPRRGTGDDSDVLLGDLLITDPKVIRMIANDEKLELSCGYSFDYDHLGSGMGRQKNIRINHVALVKRGRCGPRCCIGDAAPHHCDCEDCANMAKTNTRKIADALRAIFKTGDEAAQEEAINNLMEKKGEDELSSPVSGDGEHHVHVHLGGSNEVAEDEDETNGGAEEMPGWFKKHAEDTSKRFDALEARMGPATVDADEDKEIEGQLEIEAPNGATGDAVRKAHDSAYLADAYQEAVSFAEMIAPGINVPAFDRKAPPRKSFDSINGLRKKTLELAYVQPSTRDFVADALGGKPLDTSKMTFDGIRTAFRTVGGMARLANKTTTATASATLDDKGGFVRTNDPLKTPADINRFNRERKEKRLAARPSARR